MTLLVGWALRNTLSNISDANWKFAKPTISRWTFAKAISSLSALSLLELTCVLMATATGLPNPSTLFDDLVRSWACPQHGKIYRLCPILLPFYSSLWALHCSVAQADQEWIHQPCCTALDGHCSDRLGQHEERHYLRPLPAAVWLSKIGGTLRQKLFYAPYCIV